MKIKPIDSHPHYSVTDDGSIFNNLTGRKRKTSFHLGYEIVRLTDVNGQQKNFRVHRLVALAFIPKPADRDYVDHIDRSKINNKANNLRWVTSSENNRNTDISISKQHNCVCNCGFKVTRIIKTI